MPESLGMDELNRRFSPAQASTAGGDQLVQAMLGVAILVNRMCPAGRETALALTHLEEVKHWALAAIAGAR